MEGAILGGVPQHVCNVDVHHMTDWFLQMQDQESNPCLVIK